MKKLLFLLIMLVGLTGPSWATASGCTLYTSPAGGGSCSLSSPCTIAVANSMAAAGSKICLKGGAYSWSVPVIPNSGTSSQHITWEAYGDSNVVGTATSNMATGSDHAMFNFAGTFPNGGSYVDFLGDNVWLMDGAGYATTAWHCNGGHHISVSGMYIHNTTRSGVSAVDCDYIDVHKNVMYHGGYNPHNLTSSQEPTGFSSAVSYNSMQNLDGYSGVHSVIYDNIIAGWYDGCNGGGGCSKTTHTDGNAIILDLTNNGNFPPTLIFNNVNYGTGGRGFQTNSTEQINTFVLNNTFYENALDSSNSNYSQANIDSDSTVIANNIAVGLEFYDYHLQGTPTGVQWFDDMWNGANGNNFTNSGLIHKDPLFLAPPTESINGESSTIDPGVAGALLGTKLTLQTTSPARNAGIDPRTISGLNSNVKSDMTKYGVNISINGVTRIAGSWDLGAYQH